MGLFKKTKDDLHYFDEITMAGQKAYDKHNEQVFELLKRQTGKNMGKSQKEVRW